VTSESSEFRTDGTKHWKARFANSFLVNGTVISEILDDINTSITGMMRAPLTWV